MGVHDIPLERELVFHDTISLPLEQLEKGRKKAVRQKDRILAIFRNHPELWFTPYQIQEIYEESFELPILITSVRRSITDLTMKDSGKLIKGGYGDQSKEKWGINNNRWRYNTEYVNPINPDVSKYKKYIGTYKNVNWDKRADAEHRDWKNNT
jgi:hypothetical protein